MKNFKVAVIAGTIFALLFSFNAYAIHNLKINNLTSATVTTTDSLHITANFEASGAKAKVILYYDTNGNGTLDSGEPWIAKFKIIDGNFADDDGAVNGSTHLIYDPITLTGKFVLYAEDGGVSQTVALQVNPTSSSLQINGTVTSPANTAHLLVGAVDTLYGTEVVYGDFTDGTGAYSISLPPILQDSVMSVAAIDMFGVVPSCYMSSTVVQPTISGTHTFNFNLYNISSMDSTVVFGTLKDDAGTAITDPAQIAGIYATAGGGYGVRRTTNTSGQYRFTSPKEQAYYMVGTGITDQFYPDYLNPLNQMKIGFYDAQIQLDLTAYRTNDSICGTVYKDSLPYRYAQLDLSGIFPNPIGGTYTKTCADGHYVARVSNTAMLYSVRVAPKSIPAGYRVVEWDSSGMDTVTAMPGATGVDFHLVNSAVEENQSDVKQSIFVRPNPFINSVKFELSDKGITENLYVYDIAGNRIMEISPQHSGTGTQFILSAGNKKMPTGVYFYSIKSDRKTYEGKLIRL